MSERNVLQLERDSISDSQKELYNADEINPLIETRFSLDVGKRSQGSSIDVKLEHIVKGEEGQEVVYKVSNKFDNLIKLEAYLLSPLVKVKERWAKTVSICYHHHLGHNFFQSGECKFDNDHAEYLDTVSLNIHLSYFRNKRKQYDCKIGNVSCFEEWTTKLPSLPLVIDQPYSFTRAPQVSLPLLKSSKNSITFEYKLRRKLVDLVRMRVLTKDGKYKEIKCNLKYLEKPKDFPVPEMWGKYSENTDAERNWRKTIDERTGEPFKQVIYTEDIYSITSQNPEPLGKTVTIPLEISFPTKHIFWMASLVGGNLSNYTTDKMDVRNGWNPCGKACIKYAGDDRVPKLSCEHFDSDAFPKAPREKGYNVYTFTFKPTEIQYADNAVVLKKCGASLNVTLEDTNPFIDRDEDENEDEYTSENGDIIPKEALDDNDYENANGDKYIIHVRAIVMKKLEVSWDDKSEKVKYVFS